jgi:hypothetical protein
VFPSVTPSIPYAGSAWTNPPSTNLGFASNEGGIGHDTPPNLGTSTTATISGYSCVPVSGNAVDCEAGSLIGTTTFGTAHGFPPIIQISSPGIENLQCKISTNGAGVILVATCSASQEFDTLANFPAFSHPDSFNGNYITVSGIGVTGSNNVQIDKKNNFNVTFLGAAGFDPATIDQDSLRFGPGLYWATNAFPPFGPTLGSENHEDDHNLTGGDLTAHFASNESDLECGEGQVKVRGTSEGVAFVVSVSVNGIGKACRPVEE